MQGIMLKGIGSSEGYTYDETTVVKTFTQLLMRRVELAWPVLVTQDATVLHNLECLLMASGCFTGENAKF